MEQTVRLFSNKKSMLSNTLWEYATKGLIVTVATQKLVEQKSKSVHGYKLKITHTTTE